MSCEQQDRYAVVEGSQTAHCCFEATVVDLHMPTGYMGRYDPVCECMEAFQARMICDALNAAHKAK